MPTRAAAQATGFVMRRLGTQPLSPDQGKADPVGPR